MTIVGSYIQKIRREKGLRVEEVASGSGLSVGTIRSVEQGRRNPSVEALRSIFGALDMPEDEQGIEEGIWTNPDTDEKLALVPFAGFNKHVYVKKNVGTRSEEDLRTRAMRLVMDSDEETLSAIVTLLSR